MAKKMNKKELIAVLVDNYGYDKDDIKTLTNAKLELMIKQEEKDAEVLERQEAVSSIASTVEPPTELKDDDMIHVMNGAGGELIHRSQRTGRMWKFTRFGQTDRMPFMELMNIYNVNPKCFEEGRLIVLDNRVAENFRLSEIYKNIITPKNIDELFTKDIKELEVFVKNLPEGMKFTFVNHARNLYTQGKLDSIAKKNFIEEAFGFSLDDNAPISDKV
jgi:hypothetical protein